MSFDAVSIGGFFLGTVLLVVLAIEMGFRLGRFVHTQSDAEKESPVSAISGATMGLMAFILAFTFAIVADRYDTRKALVREDANVIRTAFLRADFLPAADRDTATGLLAEYLDIRLDAGVSGDTDKLDKVVVESRRIHRQLWDMAVANARLDMNSDVAALYIESLNELTNLHALRMTVALGTRLPDEIWTAMFVLLALSMMGFGYQTAIAGSQRSWATPFMALSFALVVVLIAALDRPLSGYFIASQQPLVDLRAEMTTAFELRKRGEEMPIRD